MTMNYLNIKVEEWLLVVMELNTLLADYNICYKKLTNFRWNILGKNFFDLNIKFEEIYYEARIKIDETAERILTLRFHPMSNLEDYFEISPLKEISSMHFDEEMVNEIINDHINHLKNVESDRKSARS